MLEIIAARHHIDHLFASVNESSASEDNKRALRKGLEAVDACLRPLVLSWLGKEN